jgi:hypothetical protein
MTWLGKILTFVVMIGAALWAYFTVQAFVTRANWKAELDRYKVAFKESEAARVTETARSRAAEDALKRLLVLEQDRSSGLKQQVAVLDAASKKAAKEVGDLQNKYDKADVQATQIAANLQNTMTELDQVRARNIVLADEQVKLVIAREDALREKVRAENYAKLQASIAEDYAKRNENLNDQVATLKATGGDPSRAVPNSFNKPPPPSPENLRGTVEGVAGDLVHVSVGIDAGVSKNTVLDVVRTDNGGRFVGTLKVFDVHPKYAIAVFTPARNVPMERLRPEELPRKGDEVRPPNGR